MRVRLNFVLRLAAMPWSQSVEAAEMKVTLLGTKMPAPASGDTLSR